MRSRAAGPVTSMNTSIRRVRAVTGVRVDDRRAGPAPRSIARSNGAHTQVAPGDMPHLILTTKILRVVLSSLGRAGSENPPPEWRVLVTIDDVTQPARSLNA